jgi:hypothetical protein
MNKIFPIALFLLGAMNSEAQQLQAKLSSELKFDKKINHNGFLGISKNTIYALAQKIEVKPINNVLYGYSSTIDAKTMTLTNCGPIVVPDKDAKFLDLTMLGGQAWLFTRSSSKKNDVDFIKAYKLDTKGQVEQKAYPIAEFVDKKNLKLTTSEPVEASVGIRISDDSSKFCIIVYANEPSKEKAKFYIKVLNIKDMTMLWEQSIILPFERYRYQENLSKLTNDGNFVIGGKLYNGDDLRYEVKDKKPSYKYILYDFDGSNSKGNDYILDLGDKFMNEINIAIREDNGNTVITGMYANEKNKIVNGFYYMEIEKNTGTVINKYLTEIQSDKIKYASSSILEKKKNGLVNFARINSVYFKKNGGFLLATSCHQITSGGGGETYDDIIFSISSKGSVEWATAVPRNFGNQNFSKIFTKIFYKNDNFFIVYSDNEANVKLPLDKKVSRTSNIKNNALMLCKIDPKGKLSRRALISAKTMDGYFLSAYDYVQTGKNEWSFSVRKYNQFTGETNTKICRMSFVE